MYRNASSTLNQSRAARTLQTERQDSKICPEISVPLEITKHNLREHIRSLLHRKTPKQLTFTNIQNREKREERGGGGRHKWRDNKKDSHKPIGARLPYHS